ncbi:MAG: FGGY-family carbohydrate kinase [Actinomycetes bacterium]
MLSLGLDVGSTNLKAVLVEVEPDRWPDPKALRPIASATAPTPRSGAELVARALMLIEDVAAAAAGRPTACVGIASMAETGVPLDADDQPLGDLVRWDGERGRQDADRLAAALGADALFAATGVRPAAKAPLAVWSFLGRTEPDRWARMRRWAGAADLVALALTGRLVTDHTLAGRTMAYRLPAPGQPLPPEFDADLLGFVGMRTQQLPSLLAPGTAVAAPVRAGGVAGLRPGTPVVVAGHDHAVGTWAVGVRRPGQVANSVGTAESVTRVLATRPEAVAVRRDGMSLVRTVAGDRDAVVAGSASAGAMFAWWSEQVASAVNPLTLLAHQPSRPTPSGFVVLPYLHGRQAPVPDPDARARFVGDVSGRAPAALAQALLDGLSLHSRWLTSAAAELTGQPAHLGEAVVLGGAVRPGSPWLQTKVAMGPARTRGVGVDEPVAVGAALLAACRVGELDPETTVLPTSLLPRGPEPAYEEAYRRFVAAALAP